MRAPKCPKASIDLLESDGLHVGALSEQLWSTKTHGHNRCTDGTNQTNYPRTQNKPIDMTSKPKRQFDFCRHKQRHVALKILYFGWDYNGLAAQVDSEKTIEFHLFQALDRVCLIESRDKCNYNRCGRTDKGVSSYGQVVNLNIRSNLLDETDPQNVGLFTPDNYTGPTTDSCTVPRQELNYVEMLNRVLPEHIKAIAWAPVKANFSARFSCQSRSYFYLFPLGDLNLQTMREALGHLVGEHDFRNLCSFDLKHGVTNHTRTILSARIEPIQPLDITTQANQVSGNTSKYSFFQIIIVGQAFLYHQIRCIMTILFLVATGKETPDVVRDLLDIKKCPGRPNYNRASPLPLCLFDCQYTPDDLPRGWKYDLHSLAHLRRQLKQLWTQYKTKTMMIERVLADLDPMIESEMMSRGDGQDTKRPRLDLDSWKDFGLECDNMSDTKYVSLLKRARDEPLEKKLETLRAKGERQVEDKD